MYNKLIEFLNNWGTDIHKISIKYYDNYIEILVNECYIYNIRKDN